MKTDKDYTEQSSRRGFFSSSYHRHFEGYAEYEMVDEKGEARIQRVYTGMYYIPELDKKQRILHQLVQSTLWLLAWAVFIFGASRQGAGNGAWYVGLWQAVDIAVLVWVGAGIFNYLIASQKMTVGEWRSSAQRVKHGCICASITMVATCFMTILDLVLTGENVNAHLIGASSFLGAALCMAVSWRKERRLVYKRVPSDEHAPGYAAQIR